MDGVIRTDALVRIFLMLPPPPHEYSNLVSGVVVFSCVVHPRGREYFCSLISKYVKKRHTVEYILVSNMSVARDSRVPECRNRSN